MNNLKLDQFKDFKNSFTFDMIGELSLHSNIIKKHSYSQEIVNKSKDILQGISFNNRSKSHTDFTIVCEYILYLCNFMQGHEYENFDKIYYYYKNNNDDFGHMDSQVLKEITMFHKVI